MLPPSSGPQSPRYLDGPPEPRTELDRRAGPLEPELRNARFGAPRRVRNERIDPSPFERVRALIGLAVIVLAAGTVLAFTAAALTVLVVRVLTAALG